ncbi:MAG: aminotransferase class I/II-fold pyridoxal phosphate-dependent enzyme [Pseudomonadales bacterium]|nr:aminotransferase class I/II-fold pyridoxal phosphate-dependent enzyme [Pseudomonadales bacterium]
MRTDKGTTDVGAGALAERSSAQLKVLERNLSARYHQIQAAGLSLDLTRGKPCPKQLDLSAELDGFLSGDYKTLDGQDCRNYGGLSGIPEAKSLGAELMQVPAENVLAGGNSSLTLMFQSLQFAMQKGLWGTDSAWQYESSTEHNGAKIKFLCPVPGYDRHFAICESLGIEMINIPFTEQSSSSGPDMQKIYSLVAQDPLIKGIWCVPKFSNPTGCTYSDDAVEKLANLPIHAGRNFLVMWDNAYSVHSVMQDEPLTSIFDAASKAGTRPNILTFSSTSKITFAGSGVGFMGAEESVLNNFLSHLQFQTIGYDKVNQLRNARFLKNNLQQHMAKHAKLIKPKFTAVQEALSSGLSEDDIARWTHPNGGYFVSLDVTPGLAKRVVKMAAEAGVVLTPAGATYPYGVDPSDHNIRIAPTYPSLEEVESAMEILILCVRLTSVQQILTSSP